ncbi:hypothetical protein VFPPC_05361 [Pochonia chlamydosporia 170]|uniref:Uncharacterized protein n=1 Tax=Pochonia chlamydosporia 170 TaxID=1380566 RepID=A0A179FG33_METCM|nr:hypothetical protein VFPPC_05361 [Pochonia chlamydosporia 170]OAQ64009.1 hypothetical protein VFPPC_05361 [Pochonia chlamydosporia 170]
MQPILGEIFVLIIWVLTPEQLPQVQFFCPSHYADIVSIPSHPEDMPSESLAYIRFIYYTGSRSVVQRPLIVALQLHDTLGVSTSINYWGYWRHLRRQKQLAPRAGKESNGSLEIVRKLHHTPWQGATKLTPNMAMLRTTAALSGEVKVSYVEAKTPLGARRDEAFSTRTLLGAGILCGCFRCDYVSAKIVLWMSARCRDDSTFNSSLFKNFGCWMHQSDWGGKAVSGRPTCHHMIGVISFG